MNCADWFPPTIDLSIEDWLAITDPAALDWPIRGPGLQWNTVRGPRCLKFSPPDSQGAFEHLEETSSDVHEESQEAPGGEVCVLVQALDIIKGSKGDGQPEPDSEREQV